MDPRTACMGILAQARTFESTLQCTRPQQQLRSGVSGEQCKEQEKGYTQDMARLVGFPTSREVLELSASTDLPDGPAFFFPSFRACTPIVSWLVACQHVV